MKVLPILMFMFAIGLTGCEKGAGEQLGENLDDAADEAGDAIEELCEDVRDAVDADNRNC